MPVGKPDRHGVVSDGGDRDRTDVGRDPVAGNELFTGPLVDAFGTPAVFTEVCVRVQTLVPVLPEDPDGPVLDRCDFGRDVHTSSIEGRSGRLKSERAQDSSSSAFDGLDMRDRSVSESPAPS